MYDLNGLSLAALLDAAMEADIVEQFHLTEWVVVLRVGTSELVMNHANAHVFVQGLMHGSAQRRKLEEDRKARAPRLAPYFRASQRHVIG